MDSLDCIYILTYMYVYVCMYDNNKQKETMNLEEKRREKEGKRHKFRIHTDTKCFKMNKF